MLAGWFALVIICLCSSDNPAAGLKASEVRVTVITVLATDRDKHIDPKLEEFAAEVQKSQPKLTGFRLERVTSVPMTVDQTERIELMDKAAVEVTVLGKDPKTGRYRLTVKPPGGGDIQYSCCCGKFFPLAANVKSKGKDQVFIAVMIRPCVEK
jgi:hypothetical protein